MRTLFIREGHKAGLEGRFLGGKITEDAGRVTFASAENVEENQWR